jgi:Leu/Phe-tRNA-protein transferase
MKKKLSIGDGVKIPELLQYLQQGSFPFQEKEDDQDSQVWILVHPQSV